MTNRLRAPLFGALWLISPLLLAQESFTVSGSVFNEEGESLPGASVHVHENMKASFADEHGYYHIDDLKPGKYHLHVRSLGFHSRVIPFAITDANVRIDAHMEVSPNELHGITIESSGFEDEKEESSLMIERVDRDRIMKNPSGNLMQSIQEIPGINTINTGVGVGKPVIRGLSQNRVVVSEGGVKQEGQQWGNDHGLEVNQYQIEGVEIVKGASSLAYGSDALGGVLNISKDEVMPQGSSRYSLNSVYKSNNDHYGISFGGKGNHNGLIHGITISAHEFGDYRVPASDFIYNDYVLPIYNERLKNTAGKELHYSAMLGIQRNWIYSQIKYSSFNQTIGVFPGAIGIPRSVSLEHDGDYRNVGLPYQDISHDKLLWNSTIYTPDGWVEVDLAYQRNLRKEHSQPHAHGRPLDFSSDLAHLLNLQTWSANVKYKWNLNDHADLTIGTQNSFLQNQIDGFEFIIPPYQQLNSGLYAIYKTRLGEKTMFNFGLRYDLSEFKIDESFMDFYYLGDFVKSVQRNQAIDQFYHNYSGAMGINRSLGEHGHFRVNLGKTFRIPNVAELSSNGVHHGAFRFERGDPELRPEEGYQFDLSIDMEEGPWYFDLTPFINYFDNYIYLSPAGEFPTIYIGDSIFPYPGPGQLYQYKQAPALHMGGEVNVYYHLIPQITLGLRGEYVWIENMKTGLPISFTPPPSVKFEAEYEFNPEPSWLGTSYIKAVYEIYAEQDRVDRNELPTSGFELFNFMAGMKFGKNESFDLKVTVQNLFDRYYLAHLSRYRPLNIPEPGRNVVLGLTYNLKAN